MTVAEKKQVIQQEHYFEHGIPMVLVEDPNREKNRFVSCPKWLRRPIEYNGLSMWCETPQQAKQQAKAVIELLCSDKRCTAKSLNDIWRTQYEDQQEN